MPKQPAKRTRKVKTPKQRAEETLAAAERKLHTVTNKLDEAREIVEALEAEHTLADKRYKHACMNPDLDNEDDDPLPFGGDE